MHLRQYWPRRYVVAALLVKMRPHARWVRNLQGACAPSRQRCAMRALGMDGRLHVKLVHRKVNKASIAVDGRSIVPPCVVARE